METFEDKQHLSALLDVYGELLTKRQRTFIALHCNEDLSYGEIAEEESISRQAVHDTIQHGKKSLMRFEDVLRLVDAHQEVAGLEPASPAPQTKKKDDAPLKQIDEIRKLIDELCQMVQDDILYDTGPALKRIQKLQKLVG